MFELKKEILDTHEALLTIDVAEKAAQDAMQKAARQIAREINIPGFRKGKAPYRVVVNMVGEEAVRQEAVEVLIDKIYPKALEQAELVPYAPGDLEDVDLEAMHFVIRVPLMPVVDLGDYEELRMEPSEPEVTQEELDAALEDVRQEAAVLTLVERPAELGDQVILSYLEGQVEGEVIVHDHDVEVVLDKEIPFISADFVEALVGMSEEEDKVFTITLPEDLSEEELRGKEADFEVTVAEVYERLVPELDDALASAVGNFETFAELQEAVREDLLAHKAEHAREDYLDALMDALVEGAETVAYPPIMLEEEIDALVEQMQEDAVHRYKVKWEDFLRLQGLTEEDLREQFRPQAEERLERGLVLSEFAQATGVEVLDEEVQDEIDTLLAVTGVAESHPEAAESLSLDSDLARSMRSRLIGRRTMQNLERLAQGLPLEPEFKDLEEEGVEPAEEPEDGNLEAEEPAESE
ncbi:MAG: trigger factor [Anaerolineales bacterium]